MHSEKKSQGFWKLARVEDTVVERDERVRGAVIRTCDKVGRPTVLQRPIQLLYPLEINCQIANSDTPCISPNHHGVTVKDQGLADDSAVTR